MRRVKPFLLLTALSLGFGASAQQGIFYYVNTNQNFINSKTIDVKPTDNGMVILNQCSDANYTSHAIQVIELNKTMVKTSESIVNVDKLHNISGFSRQDDGSYNVLVNSGTSQLEPMQVKLSAAYKDAGQNKFADMEQNSFVSQATVGKQVLAISTQTPTKGKFDIVLSSFDANGNKSWTKKISSEPNESADIIVADNENNVIVLGRKYNDNATEYIPILYKLSADGNIIWKKSGVDMPSNFYSQTITVSKNGDIYYACGLTLRTGVLQTKVIKLDGNGNTKRTSNLNDFTSNGALWLSSGKVLLYGSRFYTDAKQVVTKGAYMILDADLNELSNKSLAVNDKPDSDFNYNITTSSDLQAAIELEGGSVAMIGKVTMPQAGGNDKHNNTIVVVADAYGNYK